MPLKSLPQPVLSRDRFVGNDLSSKLAISIALYLPQFHTIPENDEWWGDGFTEWSHLRAWTPQFAGHSLRKPAAPLGEYNLLNPEIFNTQMDLATSHGIDGFAVWDYWFGNGDRLLEKPLELLLQNRTRFRFCIAWANHSWMNRAKGLILKQQRYLGADDYDAYYRHCARHFHSSNYIKVDGKPLFVIYDPSSVPDLHVFVDRWNTLAIKSGFGGMHFIGDRVVKNPAVIRVLDGYSNGPGFWSFSKSLPWNFFKEKLRTKLNLVVGGPQRFDYRRMVMDSIPPEPGSKFVPTVLTGWDTTPRHGRKGVVFRNFGARSFGLHLQDVADFIERRKEQRSIVLVKSWNEWAEGNLLEPDSIFGTGLLEEYRKFASRFRRYSPPPL